SKGGDCHPKSEDAIKSLRSRISGYDEGNNEEESHEGNGVLTGKEKITFIRSLISIETWVMVCAVLAILLTFLGSSLYTIFDQYTRIGHREYNGKASFGQRPPSYFFNGRTELLFLIAGLDEVENASRTDTLMLAKLDFVHQDIKVISVPRDLYVELPGKSRKYWDRINTAYTRGGNDWLLKTMYGMIGFYPDFLITVDYAGFKNVIDIVGGVEIDVEKDMNYDDYAGNLHIHIKKGQQVLNGENALGYVRYRHDADGDFSRMRRQQKFLTALKKAISKPENALKMKNLIVQILDSVDFKIIDSKTEQIEDESGAEIETTTYEITDKKLIPIQYMVLEKVLKNLPNENISVQTVPVAKEGMINGKSILVPDYVQYDIMLSAFFE
ncbi:MAG: LCP family protein, partial [bacterium]